MIVSAIKTHKITLEDNDILKILDTYIKNLEEKSVVVIASKIIAIAQGRAVQLSPEELDAFIRNEAQEYIPKEHHKHKLYITINNNHLTYSSGVDESNGNGYQILWPENIQDVTNSVRSYLREKFQVKHLGIIVTDMAALPLRWGLIAGEIAYSGFKPLKDLTGTPDVFGNHFKYSKVGILNGLAASAGVVMGEGAEQTPLGIITDVPFVEFVDNNPTQKEMNSLKIKPEEDLYGPMISAAPWKKGGRG